MLNSERYVNVPHLHFTYKVQCFTYSSNFESSFESFNDSKSLKKKRLNFCWNSIDLVSDIIGNGSPYHTFKRSDLCKLVRFTWQIEYKVFWIGLKKTSQCDLKWCWSRHRIYLRKEFHITGLKLATWTKNVHHWATISFSIYIYLWVTGIR